MDNIPEKIDSKFRFVLLAAQRAEQIMQGAPARVELPGRKHSRVAMEEVATDSIEWDYGPPPEPDIDGEADEDSMAEAG